MPASRDLLTIAELARRFDLPESTARFYCKRFRDFLPHEGRGKRRRYLPESLAVFSAILESMQRSKNAAQVEASLARRFPRQAEVEGPEPSRQDRNAIARQDAEGRGQARDSGLLVQLVETQSRALQDIGAALTALARKDQELEELRERLHASGEELEALRKEVADVRRYQDEAEKIHQQDLEQLRKWLHHLAEEQSRTR